MESSGMDTACLAGLQACRPTLGAWPSPPAAHSNSILGNNISSSNSNIHSINSSNFGINSSTSNSSVSASQISMSIGGIPGGLGLGHHPASVAAAAAAAAAAAVAGSTTPGAVSFPGLMTPCSDNDNNSNMSSDCGSTNNMNGGGGGQSSFSGVASMDGGDGAGSENVGNGKSSRQNQVGSIHLHGENIVSLIIDNKERLCLAQISNTLLKEYSYNEIHNRRVALGITCVQCTPVQLEILRRAGAMPVSSRRCGMITKREAERLVRSFLEENTPPKLPDDFAFDVHHECGWGCRGFFEPSRYNSSRAKCIKCFYCNVYFSPNKFIFHFHRTSESKYSHPDAANFNSWRRHLKLYSGNENEEITYKWEDVKAMFNGGTRKRPFPTSSSSSSSLKSSHSTSSASLSSPGSHHRHHSHHGSHSHSHLSPPSSLNTSGRGASLSSSEISGAAQSLAGMYGGRSSHLHFDGSGGGGASSAKKSKQAANVPSLDSNPYMQKHPGAPFVNPFSPYWLAATSTGASKAPYPFMAMNASQSMCFGFPPAPHPGPTQHPNSKDIMSDRAKTAHLSPASWISRASAAAAAAAGGAPPFPMPSMDFFWDKAFAFPQAAGLSFRPGTYPSALMPSAVSNSSGGGGPGSVNIGALNSIGGPGASLMELPEHFNPDGQMNHSPPERGGSYSRVPHHHREIERGEKVKDHMSAFKRVRPSSSSPSSSGSPPPPHATFDDHDDIDRDCPDDANTQADRYNDNNNNYSSSGNNNNGNNSPPQNSDDKVVDGHAGGDDRDEDGVGSVCAEDLSTQRELEESEDIDVEEEGISAEIAAAQRAESEGEEEEEEKNCNLSWGQERSKADGRKTEAECAEERESNQRLKTLELVKGDDQSPEPSSQPTSPLRPGSSQSITDGRGASRVIAVAKGQDSGLSDESDTEAENRKQLVEMSPDELRNSLMNEVESRRKREKEVDVLKETFRQEVSREKSFREHMAQQLEMLRETLTTELEQERKMRFSLQQKLKEAHDALQNFSCGMLTGRKDVFPLKDSDALPR